MTETAHEFVQLYVDSGDTIEQWGYDPEDIINSTVEEDPRYNDGRTCLHVWVLHETEVGE